MYKRLIIVVLSIGLVFGGIFGWKAYKGIQMGKMFSAPPPPAVVATADVATQTWQPYLQAVGSFEATQGVYVTNEIAGQIEAIRFQSGERVDKGDVLLQLDDEVDQADMKGLIASRRLAELHLERIARLYKEGKLVSQADYDEAQAQLDSAEAQVVSKQALINKKRIRAPFRGILGIRQVDLGQYLAPGSEIVPLQILDPIYIDYSIPERQLASIAVGQTIEARVQAYPDAIFSGRVTALNPGIDAGTRNLKVRATVDNSSGQLRPGMFAEVRTVLPKERTVLTVPRMAITYAPYGDSVFVVHDKDGRLIAERRQVKTGEVRNEQVEILAGLDVGESVVRAGQVKLRNEQPVKVDNSVDLEAQAIGP